MPPVDPAASAADSAAPVDAPRREPVRPRAGDVLRSAAGMALVAILVFLPITGVRRWMPDVHGFARPLLYLAATAVVIGAYTLLAPGHTGKRRGWLAMIALGSLLLFAFGVVPQRRVNADAAAPRAWGPGTVDGGVDAAMVTRWSAEGLGYSLTLRCPGADDCLAGRTVHLALRPNVRPTVVSIPGSRFARLRTGEHRADGLFRRSEDFARTDYLANRQWAVWFTPDPTGAAAAGPPPSPFAAP